MKKALIFLAMFFAASCDVPEKTGYKLLNAFGDKDGTVYEVWGYNSPTPGWKNLCDSEIDVNSFIGRENIEIINAGAVADTENLKGFFKEFVWATYNGKKIECRLARKHIRAIIITMEYLDEPK